MAREMKLEQGWLMRDTRKAAERVSDQRNLNPHKAAVAAMALWGARYAAQNGGSMDFWDQLTAGEKMVARDLVKRLSAAPPEN